MKLERLGANSSIISMNDGTTVLFSYETPVAAYKNGEYLKSVKFHSRTTNQHIAQWLNGQEARVVPQAEIDRIAGRAS
mgnify:CR=1 FL=1